jgi:hypothetical protein
MNYSCAPQSVASVRMEIRSNRDQPLKQQK